MLCRDTPTILAISVILLPSFFNLLTFDTFGFRILAIRQLEADHLSNYWTLCRLGHSYYPVLHQNHHRLTILYPSYQAIDPHQQLSSFGFSEKFMFYHILGACFIITGILLSNKKVKNA